MLFQEKEPINGDVGSEVTEEIPNGHCNLGERLKVD